jgi:hypothetical protein
MGSRLQLHSALVALTPNVYFQPPEGLSMEYPCIVYRRDTADTIHADNGPYSITKRYLVTVIDKDPDSAIPDGVAALPMCVHNRFYAKDHLNHDVYMLYF